MTDDPLTILHSVFGHSAFRGVQGRVIDRVRAGQHSPAAMPTGAGGTLGQAGPGRVGMALAKGLTQMGRPESGEAFGNRDHTTVLHACRTIATLRKQDSVMNRDYLVLEQVLKG